MDPFPRGRVCYRAASRASGFLTRFSGVVTFGLALAFLGTFSSAGRHPTVSGRLLSSVVVVGGALLIVWGGAFARQFLGYRLSGCRDDAWDSVVSSNGGRAASCWLMCTKEPPLDAAELGKLEAWVMGPTGMECVTAEQMASTRWFHLTGQPPEPGPYEVRWYGRTARGMPFEITRNKATIGAPEPKDQWQTVPVAAC